MDITSGEFLQILEADTEGPHPPVHTCMTWKQNEDMLAWVADFTGEPYKGRRYNPSADAPSNLSGTLIEKSNQLNERPEVQGKTAAARQRLSKKSGLSRSQKLAADALNRRASLERFDEPDNDGVINLF
ncbi:hypothetical protein [Terriglobus roseus]|nr:hypothetical protein [Terriglobus roseus]